MSDDLLREASRALQTMGDRKAPPDDVGSMTRARIMASLHQEKRRRMTRLALVLPIAAVLAGTTAWAGVSGHLSAAFHAALGEPYVSHPRAQPTTPPAERHLPPSRTAPALIEVETSASEVVTSGSSAIAPPVAEPTAASSPLAIEVARPVEAPVGVHPAKPVASRVTERDLDKAPSGSLPHPLPLSSADEYSLYDAAHRAHFSERNPEAALTAWEKYLKEAPNGRFAPETRYNRALSLVRLGRKAEARAALEPFARGDFDGYRQAEARALLKALESNP